MVRGGVDVPTLKADTVALLNMQDPVPAFTGAQVAAAVDMALDRAYAVAWALRGPPAQQAALRAPLADLRRSTAETEALVAEFRSAHQPDDPPGSEGTGRRPL